MELHCSCLLEEVVVEIALLTPERREHREASIFLIAAERSLTCYLITQNLERELFLEHKQRHDHMREH